MSVPLDEVVHFDAVTSSPTTGAASDADSPPTFDVFEEATDTPILDDQTMTKRTGLTGNYRGTFTASAANGFEAGKWYSVIATATVGGVTGKAVAMLFRVGPAEATPGVPKVDVETIKTRAVSAAGAIVVGGFVGQDTAALGVNASGHVSRVVLVDTATTLTNLPAITSNWLTAAGLAADAVAEIQSGLSTLDAAGVRTAVGLASANLDTQLDTLPTAAENAAALLDLSNGIETGVTPRQALRAMAAILAGIVSGAGSGTEVFKAIAAAAGGTTRVTVTVDASGNRSALTLNL